MTNIFTTPIVDTNTAIKLAEINVKAMVEVANNQTKLFNELLTSSLGQLKSVQAIEDVKSFVESSNNYTQDVEGKLRKAFDANSTVLGSASKKSLDLISAKQEQTASSSK